MAFEEIYQSEQFLQLADLKKKSDALKQDYVQVKSNMQKKGEPFYRQIEEYLIQEKHNSKEETKSDDEEGIEIAKKLCALNIHPWRIKQRIVGSSSHTDHKKIPKYYIRYCPICGKVLSTQKRIYRWRLFKGYERKLVDISQESFVKYAGEYGFQMEKRERYEKKLPRYDLKDNGGDMYQKLHSMLDSVTPEAEKVILELLDFFDKEQVNSKTKSKRAREAEKNAEELCRIFGHDTFGPEEPCKCCDRLFSKEELQKDYENAILSGVIVFPYVDEYHLIKR